MLQIIGALCIFFFIIVPILNFFLGLATTRDLRTPEQIQTAKIEFRNKRQKEEHFARRKTIVFHIKYPFLLPGTFALLVIIASLSSPPGVNIIEIDGWVFVITVIISYLYRKMCESVLKKMDNMYGEDTL